MSVVRARLLALAALALTGASCVESPPPESAALMALPDDPGKADSATPIAIVGGLTLEDGNAIDLPVVPTYVGLVLLAPAGADLTIAADGKDGLATRVTAYGPRRPDGSYGEALGSEPGRVHFVASEDGAYLVVPQPRYVGQSGKATVRSSCSGTSCLGQCSAKSPALAKRRWVHTTASAVVSKLGSPRHRAYDQVVGPDALATLSARFTYAAIDKDLEDEDVDLWVRTCPGWEKVATARTDGDGVARVALGRALPVGEYQVLWHVPGDNTTATGTLAVWEPGRAVVVSDIDGTLTTNDAQVFKEVFLGSDPAQYPDAQRALWTARRAGYRVEYLTGRPELLGRMTKGWLAAHGFPPGPTILTSETLEVLPTESGVGDFKTAVLDHLAEDLGLWLFAGFGNATTDISAYQAAGIPNDHLFIIGPHAGERGTTSVASYGALLSALAGWPEAPTP